MGGAGMSAANYKWLIVGEGDTDVGTYTKLIKQFGVPEFDFLVKHAGGKGNVFRMNNWEKLPASGDRIATQSALQNDQGRHNFKGVIVVVDSDQNQNLVQNYAGYSQNCRSQLIAYDTWQVPHPTANPSIIQLDTLKGTKGRKLPIFGLCVPVSNQGCLETDLLRAYAYPIKDEDYDAFAKTIKEASQSWGVGKSKDGKEWWEPERNGKARIDKFMYAALAKGFEVNDLKTRLITEPQIITDIKNAMNFGVCPP
jgi:hypothetical protein